MSLDYSCFFSVNFYFLFNTFLNFFFIFLDFFLHFFTFLLYLVSEIRYLGNFLSRSLSPCCLSKAFFQSEIYILSFWFYFVNFSIFPNFFSLRFIFIIWLQILIRLSKVNIQTAHCTFLPRMELSNIREAAIWVFFPLARRRIECQFCSDYVALVKASSGF